MRYEVYGKRSADRRLIMRSYAKASVAKALRMTMHQEYQRYAECRPRIEDWRLKTGDRRLIMRFFGTAQVFNLSGV